PVDRATLPPPSEASCLADRAGLPRPQGGGGAGPAAGADLWANVGVYHLSVWAHALVELWAWHQPAGAVCDRTTAPWDDPARRPSHADRRKALQRRCLRQAFS